MKRTVFLLGAAALFPVSLLTSCGGTKLLVNYYFTYYDGHKIEVFFPEGEDVRDHYPKNTESHDDGYKEYKYTWQAKESYSYQEIQTESKISTDYIFEFYDAHSVTVEVPKGKDVKDYYPENTPKDDDGYFEYTYSWEYKQSYKYKEKRDSKKISTSFSFEYADGRPTKTIEVPKGGKVEDFFPSDHSDVFYDYDNKVKHTYTGWAPKSQYVYKEVGSETNLFKIDYIIPKGAINPSENPTWMEENASTSLLDATQEGYTFLGWYDSESGGSKITEITNIHKDEKLYARFSAITYSIIYDLTSGGVNDPNNPDNFTIEDVKTLKPASKTGYSFAGWYEDSDYKIPITIIEHRHETLYLYAKFTITPYGITYHLDGGTNPSGNPSTYTVDQEVSLLSATKNGYTFNGWFDKETGGSQVSKIEKGTTGNIELWARFTLATYTISYELYGGSNPVKNPGSYQIIDEDINLEPAYGKEAYTFEAWYKDAAFTDRIDKIAKGSFGDLTLHAHFVPNKYNSTFDLNGGKVKLTVNYICPGFTKYDKTIEFCDSDNLLVYDYYPNPSNYVFGGWYSDAELTQKIDSNVALYDSITVYGKFISRSRFEDYNFLTIGDNKKNVYYKDYESHSVDYYAYCPYYFDDSAVFSLELWAGNPYGSCKRTKGIITDETDNVTIVSGDATDSYIVRQSSSHNIIPGHLYKIHFEFGRGTVPEQSYGCEAWAYIKTKINPATFTFDDVYQQTYDAQVNMPNVIRDGYTLTSWQDEEGQIYSPGIWKFTKDKTFTAQWNINTYNVTYHLDEGTNDPNNPETFNVTDSYTLLDASKEGYTFKGWYEDNSFKTKITEINGRYENLNLYAKFTANNYQVTLDTGEGAFEPTVNFIDRGTTIKTVILGSDDTLEYVIPSAREDALFAGWYTNEKCTSVFNFTEKISSDKKLYAKWIEVSSDINMAKIGDTKNVTISGLEENVYAFVPLVTGSITLHSTSDVTLDTAGMLYDSNMNLLATGTDKSDQDLNFTLTYNVAKGNLYYLIVKGERSSWSGDAVIHFDGTYLPTSTSVGNSVYTKTISVTFDKSYTLPTNPYCEGKTFIGWFDDDGNKYDNTGIWKLADNITLHARWE